MTHALPQHEPAQNVVEYALLVVTIGILVLLGTNAFGTVIRNWLLHLAGRITTS